MLALLALRVRYVRGVSLPRAVLLPLRGVPGADSAPVEDRLSLRCVLKLFRLEAEREGRRAVSAPLLDPCPCLRHDLDLGGRAWPDDERREWLPALFDSWRVSVRRMRRGCSPGAVGLRGVPPFPPSLDVRRGAGGPMLDMSMDPRPTPLLSSGEAGADIGSGSPARRDTLVVGALSQLPGIFASC